MRTARFALAVFAGLTLLLSRSSLALAEPPQVALPEVATRDQQRDGKLDAQLVIQELTRRTRALGGCYTHELRRDPALVGSVELAFTVAKDGRVRGASITNDRLHSSAVNTCIKRLMNGQRFPAPASGAMRFTYPLRFRVAGIGA